MQFIGDNLRKFRTEAGLSRKALAQKIIKRNGKQVNARTILNWETGGKPDADSLAEMSEFFQKDLILFFKPVSYQNAFEVQGPFRWHSRHHRPARGKKRGKFKGFLSAGKLKNARQEDRCHLPAIARRPEKLHPKTSEKEHENGNPGVTATYRTRPQLP